MARQYTREFKLEALRIAEKSGNVTGTARPLANPLVRTTKSTV